MSHAVSVHSLSNLPVSAFVWRDAADGWVLTFIAKATFLLRPGESVVSPQQEPLFETDIAFPDGSSRGVYAPCDLIPLKRRADVLLVGHAFAPGGQPVRSLLARLAVSEVDKRIEVFGERHFDLEGSLHLGRRFTTMPLVYERAAGGPETANPLGVRPDVRDNRGRIPVPNLQPAGLNVTSPEHFIVPVGFGPIGATWPSRRSKLASVGQALPPAAWEGQLLSPEMDRAYFNVAPHDQQTEALREDERIVLEHLHPEHPSFVTRLPGTRPCVFVEDEGAGAERIALRADTLWIDAGRGICTVTWRGHRPFEPSRPAPRVTASREPMAQPIDWDDVAWLRNAAANPAFSGLAERPHTLILDMHAPRQEALPFAASQVPLAPRESVSVEGLPFKSQPPPPGPEGAPIPPVPRLAARAFSRDAAPDPVAPFQVPEPNWATPSPPAPTPWGTPHAVPIAHALPLAIPTRSNPAEWQPRAATAEALQLLWLDPKSLPAVRREPWVKLALEGIDDGPLDDDDEPENEEIAADFEDRREVFEILARGEVANPSTLAATLAEAVRDDGRLVQPVVLVAGELRLSFDAGDTLRATISAATPYVGSDLEAKAILDLAKEFLASPGAPGAPAVAHGLAARIRKTFEDRNTVPTGALAALAERALIAGRHYQRRSVFGAPHVRALLGSDEAAVPVYLCEGLLAVLPNAQVFRARLLTRVHLPLDRHDASPVVLRAVALGLLGAGLLKIIRK